MNFKIVQFFFGCTLCCMIAVAGCKSSSSDPKSGMKEEHEHFPKHWPGNLVLAKTYFVELCEEGKVHGDVDPEQELGDLLKWFPDFVADTEADEKSFMDIYEQVGSLEAKWNACQAKEKPLSAFSKLEELSKFKKSLDVIIDRYDLRRPPGDEG